MLDALTQNSSDLTQIANHLETIGTSLQLIVYMGIAMTVFYIGKCVNNWRSN
jgi:hypothetical protein